MSNIPAQADETAENSANISREIKFAAAKKSTWVSVWVNTLLSAWQIVAGIFSYSQGLIADGVHTLSDLIADFVVLIANRGSRKAPDEEHPYGHFRYENVASLVLGVLLLVVSGGMLWTAGSRIMSPETIPEVHSLALYVALLALLAKEGLFRYMLHVARKVKSNMLEANAWHARSDAASSLVVAIGISGSLMGYKILDPIAALVVGLFILRMGVKFTLQSLQDLMDRGADEETIAKITQSVMDTPGVEGVHDLKTRKSGDYLLVDVHIEIDENLTVKEGHDIAIAAEMNIRRDPQVLSVMTHIDPAQSVRAGLTT